MCHLLPILPNLLKFRGVAHDNHQDITTQFIKIFLMCGDTLKGWETFQESILQLLKSVGHFPALKMSSASENDCF